MTGHADGEVSVRAARPEDVEEVLGLWEQARSASASTRDDAEGVRDLIEHADDALLIAEHNGVTVGVLVAAWDGSATCTGWRCCPSTADAA